MANHVSTYICFEKLNDSGKEVFNKLMSRVRDEPNNRMWFSDMWVDGEEGSPTYEETSQYVWTTENIGPKWCYVDERGDDYIRLVSAWSWPQTGVEWMINQLAEVDNDLVVSVQYDDEMPNFFGVYVYDADGIVDGFEEDWDELKERITLSYPELNDLEEESDEWWEVMHEHMYEVMGDAQYELISEVLKCLNEAT